MAPIFINMRPIRSLTYNRSGRPLMMAISLSNCDISVAGVRSLGTEAAELSFGFGFSFDFGFELRIEFVFWFCFGFSFGFGFGLALGFGVG